MSLFWPRIHLLHLFIMQDQLNQKDNDVTKTTSDLSEDLFKVHDFDVKIDLQVPNAGKFVSDLLAIFDVKKNWMQN